MEENPSDLKTRLSHIENRLSALEKGQAKQGSGWFQTLKKLCFIVILGGIAALVLLVLAGYAVGFTRAFINLFPPQ